MADNTTPPFSPTLPFGPVTPPIATVAPVMLSSRPIVVSLGGLNFPLTPEKLTVSIGAREITYTVLDLGVITYPRGFNPKKFAFAGVFPGFERQSLAIVGDWQNPGLFVSQILYWIEKSSSIPFVATSTPINCLVYVSSFDWSVVGGFGDIEFSITLIEKRELIIVSTDVTSITVGKYLNRAIVSPYIVLAGQTIQDIAILAYGNQSYYTLIVSANPTIFVNDTRQLLPGTLLVIPGNFLVASNPPMLPA